MGRQALVTFDPQQGDSIGGPIEPGDLGLEGRNPPAIAFRANGVLADPGLRGHLGVRNLAEHSSQSAGPVELMRNRTSLYPERTLGLGLAAAHLFTLPLASGQDLRPEPGELYWLCRLALSQVRTSARASAVTLSCSVAWQNRYPAAMASVPTPRDWKIVTISWASSRISAARPWPA